MRITHIVLNRNYDENDVCSECWTNHSPHAFMHVEGIDEHIHLDEWEFCKLVTPQTIESVVAIPGHPIVYHLKKSNAIWA